MMEQLLFGVAVVVVEMQMVLIVIQVEVIIMEVMVEIILVLMNLVVRHLRLEVEVVEVYQQVEVRLNLGPALQEAVVEMERSLFGGPFLLKVYL